MCTPDHHRDRLGFVPRRWQLAANLGFYTWAAAAAIAVVRTGAKGQPRPGPPAR